jgi:hypothetical protein
MTLSDGALRLGRGILLIVGTGTIQVFAQILLSRIMVVLPRPHTSKQPTFYMIAHSVSAVLVLMAGHLLQVVLWAVVYHFDWGELGSFLNALYFSLASFTTVGTNDLALSPEHRMVGALESAVGMLMFGWSTALLVRVIQRTDIVEK